MEQKIPCEIIQDLLPLYADGLTSEESAGRIEEHLETCEKCREIYRRMTEKIVGESDENKEGNGREIDYLKRVRRRGWRKAALGAAAALVIVLAFLGIKLFVIGYPVDSYAVTYLDSDGETLAAGGVFYDSAVVYRRYKLVTEEEGVRKLVIYGCLPSAWNRQAVFNLVIDLDGTEGDISIAGNTVKRDGTVISRQANELFAAKNPYVGNMSSNGRIAQLMGISNTLGGFKNELQTKEEPYGWTLNFEDSAANSAVFEKKMKDYSCVLIALIGNLGEVRWNYTVETENGAAERSGKITEKECSEWLGASVRSFAESPEGVQQLLNILEEK